MFGYLSNVPGMHENPYAIAPTILHKLVQGSILFPCTPAIKVKKSLSRTEHFILSNLSSESGLDRLCSSNISIMNDNDIHKLITVHKSKQEHIVEMMENINLLSVRYKAQNTQPGFALKTPGQVRIVYEV